MSPRKNKIWRYFQKASDGAKCKACKKPLKTKDGNTSGLHCYLEKKHSQDYVEYSEKTDGSLLPPPKKKQRTMVEMLETKSKYDKDNSIQKQFDTAMLDYFCTDLASFSAVEGSGFKKLFDIANPKLSLHHRTTYSIKLSIRSREVQAGMKSIITEILTFGLLELRTATSLGLFMLLTKIGDYILGHPMSNSSQADTQVS